MFVSLSAKKKFSLTTSGENLRALTQITDNKYACITPFGGDFGKDLYYAVNEEGKYYNIFKKDNVNGNAFQQKTSGKNFNFSPSYCPATDKVAFRCMNEGMSQPDIYMFSSSKSKALTQVTETNQAFEGNPCISPDGESLVYDRQNYTSYKKFSGLFFLLGIENVVIIEKSEIWSKNLQSGESSLLGNGYQPQFSPDGKRIAYVKYSSDAKSCNIWIMDVDGNNLTQLTINKSHDGIPYWTKDNYIFFVSDRGNEAGKYQIWRFKMED